MQQPSTIARLLQGCRNNSHIVLAATLQHKRFCKATAQMPNDVYVRSPDWRYKCKAKDQQPCTFHQSLSKLRLEIAMTIPAQRIFVLRRTFCNEIKRERHETPRRQQLTNRAAAAAFVRQMQEQIDSSPSLTTSEMIWHSCGRLEAALQQLCDFWKSPEIRKENLHVEKLVCNVATAMRLCKFVRRSCGCYTKPRNYYLKCNRRQVYYCHKTGVKQALHGVTRL